MIARSPDRQLREIFWATGRVRFTLAVSEEHLSLDLCCNRKEGTGVAATDFYIHISETASAVAIS